MNDHSVQYKEYIHSESWRTKRSQYFAVTGQRHCFGCGEKRVHVHHKTYERLGREEMTDLVAVCERCHSLIHERHQLEEGKLSLREATDQVLELIRSAKPRKVEAPQVDPWKTTRRGPSKRKLAQLRAYGEAGSRRGTPRRTAKTIQREQRMAEYARIRDAEEARQRSLRSMI